MVGEVTGQYSRHLVVSLKSPPSTWVGDLVLQKNLKILLEIFLEDPAPWLQNSASWLNYCFLTAPPMFLHSLSSLISPVKLREGHRG